MPLSQVSARFFLELALGIHVALACTSRGPLGPGFTRLMTAFSLASLIPAWLLARSGGTPPSALETWLGFAFGATLLLLLLFAGRFAPRVETAAVVGGVVLGFAAFLSSVHGGIEGPAADAAPLLLASSVASVLVLGLVTGAMILGHWYLVTPDLPVAHLGRLTRLALYSTYAKAALLGVTAWLFAGRFENAARSFGAALGIGQGADASFQSELDFLWIVARVLIGLVGPAVLCLMTLATVKLKATQPATGILYAATVMVLMGELFAFVGGQSFGVVL